MHIKKLKLVGTDQIIVERLLLANTFLLRLRGLMFRPEIQRGEGILISPCQQVHTQFMGYPLDIVFLDADLRVVKILTAVKPWRFTPFVKEAKHVLELAAHQSSGLTVGTQLTLC